jgi:ribosomal-protein-alanine N-acetyltransferase
MHRAHDVSDKVDMIDLEIDTMKMDDLDDVMEIEEKVFSMPWSRWMFERELLYRENSCFLVVRYGDIIIGYVGFWMVEDEAHIVTIAVRKDFQRRGIGGILMASALNLAVEMGADKATLEVRFTNLAAQKLYYKFGFEIVAIRRRFYSDTGEDAYVMWLRDLRDNIEEIRKYIRNVRYRKERYK